MCVFASEVPGEVHRLLDVDTRLGERGVERASEAVEVDGTAGRVSELW
jgi:hypothetical protein